MMSLCEDIKEYKFGGGEYTNKNNSNIIRVAVLKTDNETKYSYIRINAQGAIIGRSKVNFLPTDGWTSDYTSNIKKLIIRM